MYRLRGRIKIGNGNEGHVHKEVDKSLASTLSIPEECVAVLNVTAGLLAHAFSQMIAFPFFTVAF